MSTLSHIIRLGATSPWLLLRGISLRIAGQLLGMLPFLMAWKALSEVLASGQFTGWGWLISALIACLAGQLICSWFGQLDSFLVGYKVMKHYREALANHVRRLTTGYLRQFRLGTLSALLTDHVRRIEEIFTHLLPEVVTGIASSLILFLVLLAIQPQLALALLALVPFGLLAMTLMSRHMLQRIRQQSERTSQVSGLLVEYISGIATLRLFNAHTSMQQRVELVLDEIRSASMGIEAWGGGAVQIFRLATESGLALLFLIAAWQLPQGTLDTTTWLLFVLVAYKVIDPLLDASANFTLLQVMHQSALKIEQLLAEPVQSEQTEQPSPHTHSLQLDNVSFRYEQRDVLQNISLTIPAGEVTAIVGQSGSGKSTLLHLLGRFHDPQQGVVTLGGIPLTALGTEQIYRSIGYVFQDVQLFDGSVMDNVRVGRRDASDDEVKAVCRAACCDHFIEQLPQGYDTQLGEGGQRLSGGERQRLSIARMLLKAPPIVLLDEATALLDPLLQADLQQGLSQLAQGRTVVMIAHRLKTVEFAKQIVVLEDGRIAEQGNHQQLLAQNGRYAALWYAQMTETHAAN